MNNARVIMPSVFQNKTKKEIEDLINLHIYNETKRNIAIKYYLEEECKEDIAEDYGMCRKTIYNILKKVVNEIEEIG